ncbi:MAG: AbrB/MazE/SpoVT family DNA-binding domain-containing protein [Propylenella sp.]
MELKVRKIGNSFGVILPREVLSRLHVGEGDSLSLTEGSGSYRISAYDPKIARQVEVGKRVMRRYRNTLRELAK